MRLLMIFVTRFTCKSEFLYSLEIETRTLACVRFEIDRGLLFREWGWRGFSITPFPSTCCVLRFYTHILNMIYNKPLNNFLITRVVGRHGETDNPKRHYSDKILTESRIILISVLPPIVRSS